MSEVVISFPPAATPDEAAYFDSLAELREFSDYVVHNCTCKIGGATREAKDNDPPCPVHGVKHFGEVQFNPHLPPSHIQNRQAAQARKWHYDQGRRQYRDAEGAVVADRFGRPVEVRPKAHRQMFLAGASMAFIAHRIYECLSAKPAQDQEYLCACSQGKTGVALHKADWLDARKALVATNQALQTAFNGWRKAAREEDMPLMTENELSIGGQEFILQYLPIAPYDYGTPEFIGALSRCAHFYLSQ